MSGVNGADAEAPAPRRAVDAPWSPDEQPPARLWPVVATWLTVAALLLGAGISATASVARDVYGPGDFVSRYLGMVAEHDLAGALAMTGVDDAPDADADDDAGATSGISRVLLRSDALGTLGGIEIDAETTTDDAATVDASFTLDGERYHAHYELRRIGSIFGVLPEWGFSTSPLATLTVTVAHATTFTLGGEVFDVRSTHPDTPAGFGAEGDYLVLTPSVYTLGHTSRLLTAPAASVAAVEPGERTSASVTAGPNALFQSEAQAALQTALDACTTQTVLQPTGCPFGIRIDDRLRTEPVWSIAQYPTVSLAADRTGWTMLSSIGYARVQVEVRSLYDGRVETVDENVSFLVACDFALGDDDALTMTGF